MWSSYRSSGECAHSLAEALDVAARRFGLPVRKSLSVLEPLLDGPVSIRQLDVGLAQRAAELHAHHYHRSACPISLADAVLASAGDDDRIATADPDVLAVAGAEGIPTHPLPQQG
jgi:hypothetical protein